MVKGLISLVKQHRLKFIVALLLAVATVMTGIGLMSTSGYLISRAAQLPMLVDLFMVTAAVRFFGISRAVVRYFERVVAHDMTFRILSSLRTMLYNKLDSLPLSWLGGKRPGDLLSRIVSDIEILQNTYLRLLIPLLAAAVISILTCSLLWYFDPALSLATLGFLIFSGAGIPVLAVHLEAGRGRRERNDRAALSTFLVDRIQGMQDLWWMGQKHETRKDFSAMQGNLDQMQRKNAGASGLLEGLSIILAHLGAFTVLVLAIPMVLAGEIKGVMLAMLTLGVLSSFEAVQGIGTAFLHAGESAEAGRRLFGITAEKTMKQPSSDHLPLPDNHDISFHHVTFSYAEEQAALQDVSFSASQGSSTAIVGPVGSGKSTIINLLFRFWESYEGQILLGGSDISGFDIDKLRSLFAVVSQDSYVFNRSLRENLLIAKPDATDRQLIDVLGLVGLGAFAADLDYLPGSHGMKLSGGERRLFALAQAVLKDAPIWLFDEPTAHLDADTERHVLDTIWKAGANRTQILITHRLVDMERMDQVIVMEQGKVAGCGTHAGLLAGDTIYRRMVEQQLQVIS